MSIGEIWIPNGISEFYLWNSELQMEFTNFNWYFQNNRITITLIFIGRTMYASAEYIRRICSDDVYTLGHLIDMYVAIDVLK